MFTGLVEGIAIVKAVIPEASGVRFSIEFEFPEASPLTPLALGDSVSISGCCLTVVDLERAQESTHVLAAFQAGEETLSKTRLGTLSSGSSVNFERSLRVGDRMGGHFVTGHVDGLGTLIRRQNDADWAYFYFDAPLPLLRQMVNKGSITIDGVSLTVVTADDTQFSIALIPHTLSVTTLGQLREGDTVNLETDILAKYVQRIQN